MAKIKSVDSLVFMLQCEEKRVIKDTKMIEILKEKISTRNSENMKKMYQIK